MSKERKPIVWSRHKIEQLIEIYKTYECLWDPWNEYYKHKDKRNEAIDAICDTINVSKTEFAKKIHNLRNQFNSELKKCKRYMKELAELDENSRSDEYRCRWAHFQSLMFLKDVIEPRPGSQPPLSKKARLESNIGNSSMSNDNVFIEESNIGEADDGFGSYEEQAASESFQALTKNSSSDSPEEFSPPQQLQQEQLKPLQLPTQELTNTSTQALSVGNVIDLNGSHNPCESKIVSVSETKFDVRDQWSAFGEFIANEFRHLNSELSRKKLKRKIMQAMVEVGEDDDILTASH